MAIARRELMVAAGAAALLGDASVPVTPAQRHAGEITPAILADSLERSTRGGPPALSAAIATRRGVIWTGVAGLADLGAGLAIDEANVFGIGSITKLFVAVVILQLIEQHRLALDANPRALLGAIATHGIANADTATIGELLAHSAGIPSWEDDPAWIKRGRGSGIDTHHHWAKTEALDYIRGAPATAAPGTEFHYSNSGYTLLGMIIESITQQSAAAEIRHRILTPLALADTWLDGFEPGRPDRLPHRYHYATDVFRRDAGVAPAFAEVRPGLIDATGSNLSVEWTAGGIVSSPRDLATFGLALRDGRLLSPASLAYMRQWAPARSYAEMGHGLFRFSTPTGAFQGHAGSVLGFTGGLGWAEDEDAVLAVLANVGAMHSGETPPAAYDIALNSDFTALALSFARQQRST
jgi:D-alanyl-D-alanine carboxypeptidase